MSDQIRLDPLECGNPVQLATGTPVLHGGRPVVIVDGPVLELPFPVLLGGVPPLALATPMLTVDILLVDRPMPDFPVSFGPVTGDVPELVPPASLLAIDAPVLQGAVGSLTGTSPALTGGAGVLSGCMPMVLVSFPRLSERTSVLGLAVLHLAGRSGDARSRISTARAERPRARYQRSTPRGPCSTTRVAFSTSLCQESIMGIVADYRFAALRRVYAFCTSDPLPPPLASPPAGFAAQVLALAQIVDRVQGFMTEQVAGHRVTQHTTRERASLRAALRTQHLLPLRHAARAIEQAYPGLTVHFSAPSGKAREALLLQEARAAATELAKPEFHSLFVDLLGADVLDRLEVAIQTLEAARHTNDQGRQRHVTATVGVERGLTEGRRIVDYLRVLMRSACMTVAKTDPVVATQTLRNFALAARVERHVMMKRGTKPVTTESNSAVTEVPPGSVPHLAAA